MENVKTIVDNMNVLAEFVLIKQTMVAKTSKILLQTAKDEREKFDYTFEVLKLGRDCTSDIKVGDSPVFSDYVKFNLVRVLDKTPEKMVALVIVHQNDIICIDNNKSTREQTILN